MVFRLARLWGWPNPDVLADQMHPETLDAWLAYDLAEPFGNDWTMAGAIAAAVTNAMDKYIFARAGKTMPIGAHTLADDFVPRPAWWHDERQRERELSDEESERQMQGLV